MNKPDKNKESGQLVKVEGEEIFKRALPYELAGDNYSPIRIREAQRLQDSLGFLINGLARMMRVALERRLDDKGLTPSSWTVLMVLMEDDNLPQTSLTKRTFMDAPTITRVLDMLEAKGLIIRMRDDRDRRVQNVMLTAEGRRMAYLTAHIGEDINMVATVGLNDEEAGQYLDLTRRVVQQMLKFYGDGTLIGWEY